MSADAAIDRALREAGVDGPVTGARDLSGGCIHRLHPDSSDKRWKSWASSDNEWLGYFELG